VGLLAYVAKAHGNLSGPATQRILEREYVDYGQASVGSSCCAGCAADMLVLIRWLSRTMAVPRTQLAGSMWTDQPPKPSPTGITGSPNVLLLIYAHLPKAHGSLSELPSVRGPLGLAVERELWFQPGPTDEVLRREPRPVGCRHPASPAQNGGP
jgi:hypothetical protein